MGMTEQRPEERGKAARVAGIDIDYDAHAGT